MNKKTGKVVEADNTRKILKILLINNSSNL